MTGGGTCRASPPLTLPPDPVPGHRGADSCGAGRSTFPGHREAKPNTRGVFTFPAVGIHHARPSDEGRSCAALAPKTCSAGHLRCPVSVFFTGAKGGTPPCGLRSRFFSAAHCGSWRDASHNPPLSHPGCRRPEGNRSLALRGMRGTGRCAEGSRFGSPHSWDAHGSLLRLESGLCPLCRIPFACPARATATPEEPDDSGAGAYP